MLLLTKIYTNGGYIALRVRVVGETKQQAGLADTRVTDQEQLEQVIATGRQSTCRVGAKTA